MINTATFRRVLNVGDGPLKDIKTTSGEAPYFTLIHILASVLLQQGHQESFLEQCPHLEAATRGELNPLLMISSAVLKSDCDSFVPRGAVVDCVPREGNAGDIKGDKIDW